MKCSCKQPSRSSSARRRGAAWAGRVARRTGRVLPLAALLALCALTSPRAAAAPVAVVVNSEVKVEELSFAELRRIMLGDRKYWSTGKPIKLVVRTAVSDERSLLLEQIYKMTEAQYRRHWIAKVFRAEAASEPMEAKSNDEAVELAGVLEGCITLVNAADVPEGVHVLKIDGLLPSDDGYRLDYP
jgi:ABC-type phosphate transport system substrate-binding protein